MKKKSWYFNCYVNFVKFKTLVPIHVGKYCIFNSWLNSGIENTSVFCWIITLHKMHFCVIFICLLLILLSLCVFTYTDCWMESVIVAVYFVAHVETDLKEAENVKIACDCLSFLQGCKKFACPYSVLYFYEISHSKSDPHSSSKFFRKYNTILNQRTMIYKLRESDVSNYFWYEILLINIEIQSFIIPILHICESFCTASRFIYEVTISAFQIHKQDRNCIVSVSSSGFLLWKSKEFLHNFKMLWIVFLFHEHILQMQRDYRVFV